MDLFSQLEEKDEKLEVEQPPVLTVSQISNQLRFFVEREFSRVVVEGEVSSLKVPASGHVYFNLKDENNVLNAICWRTSAGRYGHLLEEGAHVVVYGKLTTYSARSNYQIIVDKVEAAGLGALMQKFEALKNKLSDEGLFDEHLKKEIPYLPKRIGIITSPTGAVIDDMKHRIAERFPSEILLAPVKVQGVGAKEEIAEALYALNELPEDERPDVIIVARGGGSLEDLWAFNEEVVVRAIAASKIPVISAIGHEPDVTLCDFVADLRAPTPTAAAEMVVPVKLDLMHHLDTLKSRLFQAMSSEVSNLKKHVHLMRQALPDPKSQCIQAAMRLDDRFSRLIYATKKEVESHERRFQHLSSRLSINSLQQVLELKKERLNEKVKLLESYSPEGPLKRGYAYVKGADGELVRSSKVEAQHITIRFSDGERGAKLDEL